MIAEAIAVAAGECPPRHSSRDYLAEAERWAARQGRAGETTTESFARLTVTRSPAVDVLYRAAACARALDDLDASELIPSDAPAPRAAWTDLLALVAPHARPGETLPETLRRMLRDNLAARALWILLLQR